MNNFESGPGEKIDPLNCNNREGSREEPVVALARETITGKILSIQALLKVPEKAEDSEEEDLPF